MTRPPRTPEERRARIRALLRSDRVATQEQLRQALLDEGVEVTQATLSRDLRQLRALRVTRGDGGVCYEVPEDRGPPARGLGALATLVERITHNEALIVVHTAPGAAHAVARAIDLSGTRGVLGSLAGDDTILVTPTSIRRIKEVKRRLLGLLAQRDRSVS